ncbi:MAG: hypothetical protein RLZZ292_364 [Bacteroidota bacterium]|jgi:hypothetical protein
MVLRKVLPLRAGLISSIFRVKNSNSNPNLKIKFKPKRPKYGRNHGFEFEFCVLNLNFKTIKTKNYIELINPALGEGFRRGLVLI